MLPLNLPVLYFYSMDGLYKTITELCRELRKRQTPSETKLWEVLRNRKLDGNKFLRQHPLVYADIQGRKFFFIADFYCAKYNLVIEADGAVHFLQKEYDKNRDLVINGLGIKVIRFSNDEIEQNLGDVINTIKTNLA